MWVFGYGSLMWDGWENSQGCLRRVNAILPGFRREFNKASVDKWGTKEHPGPTLNLEVDPAVICRGTAFEFPDEKRDKLLDFLKEREARDPALYEIQLDDGLRVGAFVAIYTGKNLIKQKTVPERAEMARKACGSSGRCFVYVQEIAEKLRALGLEDQAVNEFWQAVQRESRSSV